MLKFFLIRIKKCGQLVGVALLIIIQPGAYEERVTTAYTQVPSKSKLLANKLPNKETTFQIKRHSDDIKPTCSLIAM